MRQLPWLRSHEHVSDIFISYAEEDRTRAGTLGPALEELGWSLFWAHGIPAGRNWRDVIDAELAQAKCMIVIWSKTSIRSGWVCDEAEDGLMCLRAEAFRRS